MADYKTPGVYVVEKNESPDTVVAVETVVPAFMGYTEKAKRKEKGLAIRAFPGIGTLVWGARTLDGNSQDWRYINVTRTMIMIEQSLKLATRAYVFEPNDADTWATLQSMMNNFLFNLWKQGALAGATPEQAYGIQVGLGTTMTPNDILDGVLRITVQVAIVRPADYIVITFQQQQQQS